MLCSYSVLGEGAILTPRLNCCRIRTFSAAQAGARAAVAFPLGLPARMIHRRKLLWREEATVEALRWKIMKGHTPPAGDLSTRCRKLTNPKGLFFFLMSLLWCTVTPWVVFGPSEVGRRGTLQRSERWTVKTVQKVGPQEPSFHVSQEPSGVACIHKPLSVPHSAPFCGRSPRLHPEQAGIALGVWDALAGCAATPNLSPLVSCSVAILHFDNVRFLSHPAHRPARPLVPQTPHWRWGFC